MRQLRPEDDGFEGAWSRLLERSPPIIPSYSQAVRGYHVQSALDEGHAWEDHSLIVESESGKPLAGFFGGTRTRGGGRDLSFGDIPCAVVTVEGSREEVLDAEKALVIHVKKLLKGPHPPALSLRDFTAWRLSGLSTWLLARNAVARPKISRLIDLSLALDLLWSGVRKSYRNLVNRAVESMEIEAMDASNASEGRMDEFKTLHTSVAGRQTRSDECWRMRLDQVLAGKAFLLMGRLEGDLVTAGFFDRSGGTCRYGSSASRRDLFDKPMFHGLMWKAVEKAKEDGDRFLDLGDPGYDLAGVDITDKEANIGTFKAGFGGHDHLRVELEWSP